LLEAWTCEQVLRQRLAGLGPLLATFRREALECRPLIDSLPPPYRPFESFARTLLNGKLPEGCAALEATSAASARSVEPPSADQIWAVAEHICGTRREFSPWAHRWGKFAVIPDLWTCDYVQAEALTASSFHGDTVDDLQHNSNRSAKLTRRPKVREAQPDEDDKDPGAWMVQTAEPLEHAEDPMGLQRPVDKDEQTAAEE